ncbi:HofP DNA utilization family protein [Kluyvera cryocrescens]|uniref:HofP DNA utilization family protein n=1 Tax=Kluyvera cryocrescens TaxID=580 RepID=UPI00155E380D|nr:HofP DNA utilization family protein [Kluyvera cryocrescens]
MKNPNYQLLLYLTLPLICGMRDPFVPVMDTCQAAQLSLWHLRGVMQSADRWIGMLESSENKWHRIEQGERLYTGWQVSDIKQGSVTVDVGPGCEPRYWQWKREGTQDDKKDRPAVAAERAAVEPSEKRLAGGR